MSSPKVPPRARSPRRCRDACTARWSRSCPAEISTFRGLLRSWVPVTKLPDRISRIDELAHDLWWSWNQDAREVFRRLDYPLWRLTAHNPVRLLKLVSPETIALALSNPQWLDLYDRAIARLDAARA